MQTIKAVRTMHGWKFEYSTITKKIQHTKDDKLAAQWIRDFREMGYKITHYKGRGGMYQCVNGTKD